MDNIIISFEGGEGAGKSTQIKLLAARLSQAGYSVCCLREPGGTEIGEHIRHILLDTAHTNMAPLAELLLYEAARAQLVAEVIRPALARGCVVLIDRFSDSTIAYQAYARGLDEELVEQANAIGSEGLIPTRTILLQQDVASGLKKATRKGADRLEAEGQDFHERVHAGFAKLALRYPARIKVVPFQKEKRDTHERIFAALADLFDERAAKSFTISNQLLKEIKDAK